ncbi:helix-turn-helix domain-containing protein [Marinibaculum pumilum]|uniref:Helix-turn-helix domain-containing protein n=1 Tax=Marinibaculum pumilum TaxID=1766165 RepID=A0ABV7L1H7_9PROT
MSKARSRPPVKAKPVKAKPAKAQPAGAKAGRSAGAPGPAARKPAKKPAPVSPATPATPATAAAPQRRKRSPAAPEPRPAPAAAPRGARDDAPPSPADRIVGRSDDKPRRREDLSLEVAIGRQVRTIRQSLGITITELARATSLSVGMLSKLENGQTSPSLTSLQSLATALNVPMTALFARFDESRDATFVRAGEGLPIERRGSRAGHLYQLLGNSMRGEVRVEPFLITLDEEASTYPVFEHPGYEFIYMLQGRVIYRYADRTYTLGPGDSLFFESDAPHGPAELLDLPAIYLSVIISSRA